MHEKGQDNVGENQEVYQLKQNGIGAKDSTKQWSKNPETDSCRCGYWFVKYWHFILGEGGEWTIGLAKSSFAFFHTAALVALPCL